MAAREQPQHVATGAVDLVNLMRHLPDPNDVQPTEITRRALEGTKIEEEDRSTGGTRPDAVQLAEKFGTKCSQENLIDVAHVTMDHINGHDLQSRMQHLDAYYTSRGQEASFPFYPITAAGKDIWQGFDDGLNIEKCATECSRHPEQMFEELKVRSRLMVARGQQISDMSHLCKTAIRDRDVLFAWCLAFSKSIRETVASGEEQTAQADTQRKVDGEKAGPKAAELQKQLEAQEKRNQAEEEKRKQAAEAGQKRKQAAEAEAAELEKKAQEFSDKLRDKPIVNGAAQGGDNIVELEKVLLPQIKPPSLFRLQSRDQILSFLGSEPGQKSSEHDQKNRSKWADRLYRFQFFMLPEYLITRLENIWRLAHSAPKNIVLGGTAEDQIKQVVQEMQQSHVARAWIFITHASMCHAAHRVFETRWKEVHVDLRSDGGSGSLEGKAKKVAKEEFAAANLRVDGLTPTPKAIRKDEQRWLRLFAYGKHMAALATAFGPDDIRPCNAILIAIPFEQLGKLGKTRDNSQIPRYVWEWLKKRFGDEDVKPCLSRVCQVAQEYSEDGVILRRMSLHPRNPNPEEDVNLPDVDQDSVPDRIKDIRSYTVFRHRLVRICQESKVCVPKRFPDVVSADETDPTDLLLELRSTEADSEMMYQYHNVVLNRDIPCELPYAEIDNFFRPGGLSLSSRAVSAVLTAATTESDWLLVRSSELRKASSEPKPDRDGRWTYPIDKYLVVFCPNVVLDAHSYPLKSPEAILTRLNAASKGNESSDSHTSHNSGIPASPVQYREEWDALKMDSKILMAVFMFKGNKNAAVHVINPLADYVAMATQRDDLARTEKLVRDWLPSCVESITFTEVSVPKPASKDENDLCVILHGLSILRTGSVYPVQVTKEITEQYLPHFGKHLICSGKRK